MFYKTDERIAECRIAGQLAEYGFSIEDFGALNCERESHLFRL